MKFSLVSALLLACVVVFGVRASEEEVKAEAEQFAKEFSAHDIKLLDAEFTADAVLIDPAGEEHKGHDAIHAYLEEIFNKEHGPERDATLTTAVTHYKEDNDHTFECEWDMTIKGEHDEDGKAEDEDVETAQVILVRETKQCANVAKIAKITFQVVKVSYKVGKMAHDHWGHKK